MSHCGAQFSLTGEGDSPAPTLWGPQRSELEAVRVRARAPSAGDQAQGHRGRACSQASSYPRSGCRKPVTPDMSESHPSAPHTRSPPHAEAEGTEPTAFESADAEGRGACNRQPSLRAGTSPWRATPSTSPPWWPVDPDGRRLWSPGHPLLLRPQPAALLSPGARSVHTGPPPTPQSGLGGRRGSWRAASHKGQGRGKGGGGGKEEGKHFGFYKVKEIYFLRS